MNNPTDTNQASEDELDNILSWRSHCREEIETKAPGWADPKYAEMQYQTIVTRHRDEARAAIQSLIRTGKLRLLAEVRERVVGENIKWNHTERMQYSTRETDALDYMFAVNSTKDEQRDILTKLEAEL